MSRPLSPRALARVLRERFPDLRPETIRAYRGAFALGLRLDAPVNDIVRYLRLAEEVDATPVRIQVSDRGDQHYDVIIAARDYFSEFAVITGLLAAFGLDIQEAAVTTFTPLTLAPQGRRGTASGGRRPRVPAYRGPRILD